MIDKFTLVKGVRTTFQKTDAKAMAVVAHQGETMKRKRPENGES